MTDVVGSPVYSPVKSSSPTAENSQPPSPCHSTPAVQEKIAEQSVFTIAKLLDTKSSASQNLSVGETSTLIAMREKIDERLRHSETNAEARLVPQNPTPMAFMNQLQLWNVLQMMNPGAINFGAAQKNEQSEIEKALAANFNFQQSSLQENQRNTLHPLAGVSGNSSNNSDLSRISRESSNASPAGSNLSDGDQNEDEFGLNPAGGIRKKKTRTVFSRQQVTQLESAFNAHRYLNSGQRSQLAVTLGLTETQVKIWFQNRRNKWKRQANGEELNASATRPSSTGPLSTVLPPTTSGPFGSLANTEAFRLFLQSQTAQLTHPPIFGPTTVGLPQLPQMFGLNPSSKNDNTLGDNSPLMASAPNGLEIARFFASNFLNGSVGRHESPSASNSKKSSLSAKAENSSANGTRNCLQQD